MKATKNMQDYKPRSNWNVLMQDLTLICGRDLRKAANERKFEIRQLA